MFESTTNNPNIKVREPNKVFMYGAAILAVAGIGIGFKYLGEHTNPFATNLPVPSETQPHLAYNVMPGDTEGSIAAHFGHANDLSYENMLNNQLPKTDQHSRTLYPGEQLKIPTEG